MKLISRLQLVLIAIFTVVETVVLTLWLYLLGVPASVMLDNGGIAAIVLFVGLFLEHSIAIAAGDFPPRARSNHRTRRRERPQTLRPSQESTPK